MTGRSEGTGVRSATAAPVAPLSVADLEAAIRSVEPAVCFVLPRVLRRVVKQHADLPGLAVKVPHRKSYVIDREPLLEIVEPAELGLEAGALPQERVILLPCPDPEHLAAMTADEALLRYWRLLFHARVHVAMLERVAAGGLSAAEVHQRIQQIGRTEFEEIGLVLGQEGFLLPARDDRAVYMEFAAVYLELKFFARSSLPHYFPGIERPEWIDEVLSQDLAADDLFRATRPVAAPDPEDSRAANAMEAWQVDPEEAESPSGGDSLEPRSKDAYRRLVRRAEEAASTGNVVRSAIYRARAELAAPSSLASEARAALKADLDRLIHRLLVAMGSRDRDPQRWREPLLALARQTPRGIWTVEARLLYDLQKVCVDHERDIYTVDLADWGLSLGQRPIKRPLPNQRTVLISKHLRSAERRLAAVVLPDNQRLSLSRLLRAAAEWAEQRLRSRLRPLLVQALDEVGLKPKNLPEKVARLKLIEELLDRVVDRGFLVVGDLRDAISRNGLKLSDCSRLEDFVAGDQLLRTDRRLSFLVGGVYNRAEIYLRWMLRLSSWAFGTETGRFFTQYLAVPFGGAYLVVAGIEHVVELINKNAHLAWHLRLIQVVVLGLFFLGLMHVESFRRGVWRVLKTGFRAVRSAVSRGVSWLVRLPVVRWLAQNRLFKLGVRFVVKPLALTAAAYWLLPEPVGWQASAYYAAALFLGINLLLNSRLGRNLEEIAADWLVQVWHRFGIRALTGLFWLVMDLFKGILQAIERMLYAVDEWLRFRSGESRASLVSKALLGLVWFFLTYVIRFCVNLLIEPQINPIKHFPVVTVSHKLLLPFIPTLTRVLVKVSVEKHLAATLATAIIFSIPGIIGFLVWELKENWRLYDANRPRVLPPVKIGSHGETMMALLRPGFHSGTLPKRFAKLRRAERKARAKGKWRAVRKHLQALEHIELVIRRFVERELLPLLAESRFWDAGPVGVDEVHVSTNCVAIALSDADSPRCFRLVLAVESGWLVAGVVDSGWSATLAPGPREVFRAGLLGLYKSAGVELIREQLDAQFLPPAVCAPDPAGLIVWPDGSLESQVRYNLRVANGSLACPLTDGTWFRPMPTLDRQHVVFTQVPVAWQQWVAAWQQDQLAEGPPGGLLPGYLLLPRPAPNAVGHPSDDAL